MEFGTVTKKSGNDVVSLHDRPLLKYLCEQNVGRLEALYESPAAAFVIFRFLPSLAQQCVLKGIWQKDGYIESSWYRKSKNQSLIDGYALLLKRLAIMTKEGKISPAFCNSYLTAVHEGTYRSSELKAVLELDEKSRKATSKDLEKKALERWECILHYVALPSQKSEKGVSSTTKQLFKSANLTSGGDGEGNLEITSSGFQFLLLNRMEQIWTYLLHYFRMEQSLGKDDIQELVFLFRIMLCVGSTSSFGKNTLNDAEKEKVRPTPRAFVIDENWTEDLKNFLMHLRELGLIFIRKRKDGYFFITPLFKNLTVGSTSPEAASEKQNGNGYIIVETNYRVYAYTDSSLQLAILSTFTEMLHRFEDMSVGVLSRDAVRRALQVGITASQIISFLRSNAHPVAVAAAAASGGMSQAVPVTVVDQIRLWEDERRRLTFTDAVVYSSFESEKEYIGIKEFSKAEGILLWKDDVQRLIVVIDSGHDKVKAWWKANKSSVS